MSSYIVTGLHSLKKAKDCFEDLERSSKGGRGERIAKRYLKWINWIYNDFITEPYFTEEVRNGCREEWNSDAFSVDSLTEKISLLNPAKRELAESIVDAMLKGEEVTVVDCNPLSLQ
jgi:hypothetical protein